MNGWELWKHVPLHSLPLILPNSSYPGGGDTSPLNQVDIFTLKSRLDSFSFKKNFLCLKILSLTHTLRNSKTNAIAPSTQLR